MYAIRSYYDCDGWVDENPTAVPWYADRDGDGFGDPDTAPIVTCAPVIGRSLLGTDCDDADPNRFPGNLEVCDGEGHDEDCDPTTLGPDFDRDHYVDDRNNFV